MNANHTKLGVMRTTYGKFEAAKASTRIPMSQIADIAVQEFLERRGINADQSANVGRTDADQEAAPPNAAA